jgi:hypothetical protein
MVVGPKFRRIFGGVGAQHYQINFVCKTNCRYQFNPTVFSKLLYSRLSLLGPSLRRKVPCTNHFSTMKDVYAMSLFQLYSQQIFVSYHEDQT